MSDYQTVKALLQKLQQRIESKSLHTIDVDIMLQHTRDLYEAISSLQIAQKRAESTATPSAMSALSTKESSGIFIEIPLKNPANAAPEIVETEKELIPEINADEGEIYNAIERKIDISKIEVAPPPKQEIDAPQPEGKKDIRKNIGINDRYLFMNELFHNDKFDYESVLDYINQSKSKEEVEAWLNAEYIDEKKWDKEDSTVALFYGLLDKHFSNMR